MTIGHFRVPPGLCFKTRLSAQPLIWKWFFIVMQIKLIFTRKVVHLASFWKWGFLELGSGLLHYTWRLCGFSWCSLCYKHILRIPWVNRVNLNSRNSLLYHPDSTSSSLKTLQSKWLLQGLIKQREIEFSCDISTGLYQSSSGLLRYHEFAEIYMKWNNDRRGNHHNYFFFFAKRRRQVTRFEPGFCRRPLRCVSSAEDGYHVQKSRTPNFARLTFRLFRNGFNRWFLIWFPGS